MSKYLVVFSILFMFFKANAGEIDSSNEAIKVCKKRFTKKTLFDREIEIVKI